MIKIINGPKAFCSPIMVCLTYYSFVEYLSKVSCFWFENKYCLINRSEIHSYKQYKYQYLHFLKDDMLIHRNLRLRNQILNLPSPLEKNVGYGFCTYIPDFFFVVLHESLWLRDMCFICFPAQSSINSPSEVYCVE